MPMLKKRTNQKSSTNLLLLETTAKRANEAKANRRKAAQIRAEMSEVENRKTHKGESWFFTKTIKLTSLQLD